MVKPVLAAVLVAAAVAVTGIQPVHADDSAAAGPAVPVVAAQHAVGDTYAVWLPAEFRSAVSLPPLRATSTGPR